jgi:3-dehydroquinate dehydratase type II
MLKKILLINGVNLNKLDQREREYYGSFSLEDIEKNSKILAAQNGFTLDAFQSNIEGEIVEMIHNAKDNYDGLIINAGAYSHYSIAIYDALKMVNMPIIEVHLSNIYKREEFRHHSYIAKIANGGIFGLGANGYNLAVQAIISIIAEKCQ